MKRKLVVMVLGAALLSGCASTNSRWETVAVGAALADIASTGGALEKGGFKEGNPIYGSNPSSETMLALNAGVYGGIWALSRDMDPMEKQKMWRTVAILRLLVAGYNLSQNGCACFKISF